MPQKLTLEDFIAKAKEVHGDKYDYSKVKYINSKTKICIVCPKHGEFWQFPSRHLKQYGCKICSYENSTKTLESFIEQARKIHGDKYDYSKIKYVNYYTKICIVCPIHGEFWQTPKNHLDGKSCSLCAKNKKKTTETFIEKAMKMHGDKYDYSKVEYVNNHTKVCIICREHGEFWQNPQNHLLGSNCPICVKEQNMLETKLYENICEKYPNMNFIHGYRNKTLLGRKELDIFSTDYKIAIEYQGGQHFSPIDFFGGKKKFQKQLENDKLKQKICEENNIKLFHFTYNKNYIKDNIDYNVYTDENELFEILDDIYKNNASN